MIFKQRTVGDTVIANVCISRLDLQTAEEFRREIKELATANQVILNMTSVEFVDSTGLGALLSLLRNLKLHEGELRLTGVGTQVLSIFRLVRMNRVFDIYPNEEEALSSFPKRDYQKNPDSTVAVGDSHQSKMENTPAMAKEV